MLQATGLYLQRTRIICWPAGARRREEFEETGHSHTHRAHSGVIYSLAETIILQHAGPGKSGALFE